MAHRRSNFVAQKRQVSWIGPADQAYVAVSTNASAIVASFDPGAVGLPKLTIVRSRGHISIRPQLLTGDLDIVGAFGMAIVSAQAFVAGAASIPAPFTEAAWDGWFVWQSFSAHFGFEGGESDFFFQRDIAWDIDSKAMRKVTENEVVVLMCESQVGALRISAPIRMLVKLS